jgi:CPA2 family monovalent cation:H+ antiporter-2
MIAEAREVHRIAALIEPVRDMFSAVFFVAIGLLIDPRMLVVHWVPILAITVAVIGCKVVACAGGTFLGGHDSRTSVRVGMSVAQIGEFSFIIASLGVTLKVTSDFLYPIAVAVSAITTLLTPYLIKSADGMVDWYERVAPRPLTNSFELYTQWVGQLGSQRHGSMATRLTRRWLLQVGLNAALMAGVFLAAVFASQHPPGWFAKLGLSKEGTNTLLWFAAIIGSLPMFITASRKLQALGLLIAETKVTTTAAGEQTRLIQAVVSRVIPIAGTAILGLYMLILTSALLPPLRVLVVLLVLVGFIAWLLRRSFIRVYSKAQVALLETFAHPPPPAHVPATVSSLLRDADLEAIAVTASSPAAGKLIRELQLRTQTGASIVGIQRGGANVINPGPDEEIQAGDEVLLLGTSTQITAARKALSPL